MAHGFYCSRCGWQETDHERECTDPEDGKRLEGKRYSLLSCPGFTYSREDRKEFNKIQKREKAESMLRLAQQAGDSHLVREMWEILNPAPKKKKPKRK